ncbi:hypothetical protein ACIO53_34845 [Streptomyces sp. NPDC087305]|uniref:hypothetical protein n=1 Tax=Streptomyces sp. NPDC087305 TaxID=3365781 RepID=UPI00381F7AAF
MAFGAEELRVLRRALALALQPRTASAEDVQDCLRLAESLDEAVREGVRLRAFLVADLARYRAALPGTTAGYLTLLEEALGAGYRPDVDDLSALRALRGNPSAAVLLDRCLTLAEQDVRARLARRTTTRPAPTVPASRTRLLALPGGLSGGLSEDARDMVGEGAKEPVRKPVERPGERPSPSPSPAAPKPSRPIPTPGEVFPRRKPAPPPTNPPQQLAAG